MASLGATYDASQGEQMSDRSALPPGEYLAAIAKATSAHEKGRRGRRSSSNSRSSMVHIGAGGSGPR